VILSDIVTSMIIVPRKKKKTVVPENKFVSGCPLLFITKEKYSLGL